MSEKIGRNAPCPCGSGKKYKKCCLPKESNNNTSPNISIKQFCQLLEWGLKQTPLESNQKIRIKTVELLNNTTIVCKFYPYSRTSVDIKTEICSIMAFMSSFLKGNAYAPSFVQNFTVTAYTENDEEIMYAMSSIETAELSAQGKSIEWLKNTLFQDNSEDFRQSRAKSQISEIENGLRKIVCDILLKAHGTNWWDTCIEQKIRQSAEYVYENQTGIHSTNGEELILYTYLQQLKTIISQNWMDFTHIFSDQTQFEKWIDELNLIRRDEAHNRPITISTITKLDLIYSQVLEPIAQLYPEVAKNYLTTNWRIQVKKIVEEYSQRWSPLSHVKTQHDIQESIAAIKKNIVLLETTEIQLSSVVLPPGKKELHNELTSIFRDMRSCFEDGIKNFERDNFEGFREAAERYMMVSKRIPEYTQKFLMSEL